MAKGKSKSPVVINKAKFLLPKMEFFPLDEATGEGIFIKELGGKSLLEFKEMIEAMEDANGKDAVLTTAQDVEIMTSLVLLTACYADGLPFFTKDDVILLSEKSPALLQDMADVAMRLSGMTSEVTSNLPNDPQGSSTTD